MLLIPGSLVIGLLASKHQAEGLKPFTTEIFKDFLALFPLDMGITSGKKLSAFPKKGDFAFLFAILVANASYVVVPAAIRMQLQKRIQVYIFQWL